MERKTKKMLTEYFEMPKPERKLQFIRQFQVKKINIFHMVRMQIGYISKWVWLFSGVFCVLAFLIARYVEVKYMGAVYAIVPFLVMVSVTESMRSYRYGMEELELSSQFSLKSIVLARMIVLGIENLLVLLIAIGFIGGKMSVNIVYIMVPYFITASSGLYIVRKMRGSEGIFLCFGISVFVCIAEMTGQWQYSNLFEPEYLPLWNLACGIGILLTIRESYRTIRMMEVLAWN